MAEGKVTFSYRDRKDNNKLKEETVDAHEFIRRFLLHVLPHCLMKIRYFGFLANRCKKKNISRCRQLLAMTPELPHRSKKTTRELMLELTGLDITLCPFCQKGSMKKIGTLPHLVTRGYYPEPQQLDSS